MRGLFGDRFLRRFATDLKYRLKQSDSRASKKNLGEIDAVTALGANTNEASNRTEPNPQNETGPTEE